MTTWSSEELVDAAISTLSARLEPALVDVYAAQAAVDAAAGRTVEMKVPRPGLSESGGDYYADAASTILRYPCVEVSVPDLRMENLDLAHVDADVTENLVVMIWEEGVVTPILARRLRRLLAAAYDVLLSPGALSDAAVETVRAAWRFNPEANERDEIISGGLLVFGLASTRARP